MSIIGDRERLGARSRDLMHGGLHWPALSRSDPDLGKGADLLKGMQPSLGSSMIGFGMRFLSIYGTRYLGAPGAGGVRAVEPYDECNSFGETGRILSRLRRTHAEGDGRQSNRWWCPLSDDGLTVLVGRLIAPRPSFIFRSPDKN